MNQCVPSWGLDDNPTAAPSKLDYEVAELTWENGQLALHGLGPPRVPNKPAITSSTTKYTWDKPRAGGTLESIVNQATCFPQPKAAVDGGGEDLVPWFDHHRAITTAASATPTMTMDALVPCTSTKNDQESSTQVLDSIPGIGTCVVGCSTRVESCSADNARNGTAARGGIGAANEWSSRADRSVAGSGTCGRDSQQVSVDTCERELGVGGFTSASTGSPENTSSGKQSSKATTMNDHDSFRHSRRQRKKPCDEEDKKATGKSSSVSRLSIKRSRAAAIHNQSERKRRDKINQRMKTLQKLVPNSSKTDKASMLDEVIEYLKQLQAQVQMMSRMNMSPMMLPLAMQQQLQMSMMTPMSMGMGMGMGMGVMDMNSIGRHNLAGIHPVLHPSAFMPLTSWDGPGDRLAPTQASLMPDLLSTFLGCQSQPMTMDAYSRMAALYQQFQQPPGSGSGSGSKN